MNVTMIFIIIGTLGMMPNDFVRELEESEIGGRAEIIQTTALL